MKPISKRERVMIGAALAVVVAIGIPGLLLPPTGAGTPSLAAERRSQQQVQRELRQVRTELEALQRQVDERVASGTARELQPRLVRAAQSAAKKTGVPITDVKPLATERRHGLERVSAVVPRGDQRIPQAGEQPDLVVDGAPIVLERLGIPRLGTTEQSPHQPVEELDGVVGETDRGVEDGGDQDCPSPERR